MAGSMLRALGASALAFFAVGCASTLESRNAAGGGVGVTYMAPMRLLTLTATRAPVLEPYVQAEVNRLRGEYSAANERIAAQTVEFDRLTQEEAVLRAAVERATTDAARATAIAAADAKKVLRDIAETQLGTYRVRARDARTAYERHLLAAITATDQWQERVSVRMGDAVGDPNHRFSADLNDSWFRSDNGTILIGANGLLQSSNVTAAGQMQEVLIGVTETILALQGAGGRNDMDVEEEDGDDRGPPSPRCDASNGRLTVGLGDYKPQEQSLEMTFDPTSPAEINTINVALCRMAFSYRLLAPTSGASASSTGGSGWRTAAATSTPTDAGVLPCTASGASAVCPGLVYRQNEPFVLNIQKVDVGCGYNDARWLRGAAPAAAAQEDPTCTPFVAQSLSFNLPNRAPLSVMPYRGATWVTRTDNVAFVDGALVSYTFTHPSEAAAAARAPLTVFNTASTSAANAISSVIQLRINLAGKQEELEEARTSLAETEVAPDASTAHIERLQNMRRVLELQAEIEALQRRLQDEAENPTSN